MLTSCKVRPADFSDEEIAAPSTENGVTESKEYEILISVGEHTDGYKAGTYTVVGDDAKTLDTLLKAKSYTGPDGLQAIGKIQLKTADSTYLLYISEDKAYVENAVGGAEVSLDDEIIKIIEKYIEKKETDVVALYKNDVKSGVSNEYRITGEDAKELILLFSGDMEDSPCDCMPTHTVIFGDKTYDVAIGDIFRSHFVIENQKHIFTIDEYKKLTALFEKCIVKDNLVGTKKIDTELRWAGEIKVTAYTQEHIIEDGVWKGANSNKKEFTITGKDAYAIYVSIGLKAFAEDQYRMPNTATLEISGKKYGLILDEGALSISNETCTCCSLDKDDDIIKVMEKYIEKSELPEGTIIETSNSTYDYTNGEYTDVYKAR